VDTHNAALPTNVAALLAEYVHYADLAEHIRALPEAVAILGSPHAALERNGILAELEALILFRLERLHALGLYPGLTSDVEVTVNGVPITLPEICRESNALPDLGSPTQEHCMHNGEESELHDERTGGDESLDTSSNRPGFLATYIRPYLGYAGTFAVGAACGTIGTHYFGTREGIKLRA
jgi:hypothetical protein